MKWIVVYTSGLGVAGGASTRGWLVAIPAIAILGLVVAQKQKSETISKNAKIIVGPCLLIFMYAVYTLLTTMSAGSASYGGYTSGVKTGAGVWLAIFGAITCGVGQVFLTQGDLLTAKTEDGKPRSWTESFREIGERAQQSAKQAQKTSEDESGSQDAV